MLDLKKYLTKVAERLNWLIQGTQYSTDAVVIDNQTVGAGGNGWLALNCGKTNKKAISIAGYMIENATDGGKNAGACTPYIIRGVGTPPFGSFTTGQVVVHNFGSVEAKIKVTLYVLYVSTAGGVIRRFLHAIAISRKEVAAC